MNEVRTCEQCGMVLDSGAPEGLCPRCVIATVGNLLLDDSGSERTSSEPERGSSQPQTLQSPEKAPGLPAPDALTDLTGTSIGRYKLLQQIGEGGFGIVFMAEQQEPVQRKVALKIIKAGMDTREIIARFEAERQALALMDHPNIAQVLDGGATSNGRPYFVMELVRGVPITHYCDQANLSTRERLELFIKVCRAVQHAHLKGVIHRDLKPSNVLVTLHDGEPVPKVIDFGVAKALGQKLTEKTLFTRFEQMLGTPAYMSPEQASLGGLDIDTRSDIYSLGVLLYELLTGVTPLDAETLRQGALDEIRRMIQETDPPKPSTRVATLGERLTDVASHRQTEPATLNRLLRGDLDWITMKALEKDRRRRYETVNGLAADIERHLRDEPVTARPPSAIYRLQKVARRHRVAFMAGAVVAVAMVLGIVISTWQAVRATYAEREQSRLRREEKQQRQRAEDNARESRDRLGRQYVANGNRLVDDGDLFGALPWFAKALKHENDNAERADIHRLRLGTTWERCPRLIQVWFHDQPVSDARFSADGRWVLTVSGTIAQVWDATTGEAVSPPLRQPRRIYLAAFSPDGQQVAIGGAFEGVSIWHAQTGRLLLRLPQRGSYSVQFSRDGGYVLTTASGDRTAQLWDAHTGKKVGHPLKHRFAVYWAEFSPDGNRIVTSDGDFAAQIWDANTLEPCAPPISYRAPAHNPELGPDRIHHSFDFSPDSRHLAVACGDGTARVCDASTGKELFLVRHRLDVRRACFSPDGRCLVTASDDSTAQVWDADTGAPVSAPLRHAAPVFDASFSPNGHYVVTASSDGTARVWEAATGRPVIPPLRHGAAVSRASFSPDGGRVVTASDDHTARVWELGDAGQTSLSPRHPAVVRTAAFTRDGSHAITVSVDGTAQVWNTHTCQIVRAIQTNLVAVRHAQFSLDGRFLAIASSNGTAGIWDWTTGRPVFSHLAHTGLVNHVEFSSDAKHIVTAGSDGFTRVWDTSSGRLLTEMRHDQSVNYASFSPDSRRLVTVCLSAPIVFHLEKGERWWFSLTEREALTSPWGQAQIFEVETGKPLTPSRRLGAWVSQVAVSPDRNLVIPTGSPRALTESQAWIMDLLTSRKMTSALEHVQGVIHASFSPDGQRVVTASWDHTARVWEAATGRPLSPPLVHAKSVHYAEFSPDGRFVVTASDDHTARAWDAATGEPLTPPFEHSKAVHRAFFTPDGGRVLTAGVDGAVKVWTLTRTSRAADDELLVAEFLAGNQIDDTGAVLPLKAQLMQPAWLKLRAPNYSEGRTPTEPSTALTMPPADADFARLIAEELPRKVIREQNRERLSQLFEGLRRSNLVASNQWLDLIDQCSQAIDLNPDGWTLYPFRAAAYEATGQFQKAINDLREYFWRQIVPGRSLFPSVYLGRGRCYLRLGKTEEAEANFQAALKSAPNDASIYNDLAWFYVTAPTTFRSPEKALPLALKAVELGKTNYTELNTLGVVYYRLRNLAQAISTLEMGIKLNKTGGSAHDFLFLAMAHQRLGDAARAEDYLAKAAKWLEDNASSLVASEAEELREFRAEAEAVLGIGKTK